MTCKHEELPQQCQSCLNLQCGYVRMDGNSEFRCRRVICFEKYKEPCCKEYAPDMDFYKVRHLN